MINRRVSVGRGLFVVFRQFPILRAFINDIPILNPRIIPVSIIFRPTLPPVPALKPLFRGKALPQGGDELNLSKPSTHNIDSVDPEQQKYTERLQRVVSRLKREFESAPPEYISINQNHIDTCKRVGLKPDLQVAFKMGDTDYLLIEASNPYHLEQELQRFIFRENTALNPLHLSYTRYPERIVCDVSYPELQPESSPDIKEQPKQASQLQKELEELGKQIIRVIALDAPDEIASLIRTTFLDKD